MRKLLLLVLFFHVILPYRTVLSIKMERDFGSNVVDNFTVYWNVPTRLCQRWKINFQPLLNEFNIVTNDGDNFRGNNINILYDPGAFPIIIQDKKEPLKMTLQNGGFPQKGSINLHLQKLEHDIDKFVHKDFSGIGVIDFEVWRPIFYQNWNLQVAYKNMSYDLARQINPTASNDEILKIATESFEKAAREFMEKTLDMFKKKRPKAKWGYYGFPYCYNYRATQTPECPRRAVKENDDQLWLYSKSTALYPSLYHTTKLSPNDRKQFMIGVLNEAYRVSKKANHPLVYPYIWYNYKEETSFLTPEDMFNTFKIARDYKMGGAIVWGKSKEVDTEDKCWNLYKYVGRVLGPALRRTEPPQNPSKNDTNTTDTSTEKSPTTTVAPTNVKTPATTAVMTAATTVAKPAATKKSKVLLQFIKWLIYKLLSPSSWKIKQSVRDLVYHTLVWLIKNIDIDKSFLKGILIKAKNKLKRIDGGKTVQKKINANWSVIAGNVMHAHEQRSGRLRTQNVTKASKFS